MLPCFHIYLNVHLDGKAKLSRCNVEAAVCEGPLSGDLAGLNTQNGSSYWSASSRLLPSFRPPPVATPGVRRHRRLVQVGFQDTQRRRALWFPLYKSSKYVRAGQQASSQRMEARMAKNRREDWVAKRIHLSLPSRDSSSPSSRGSSSSPKSSNNSPSRESSFSSQTRRSCSPWGGDSSQTQAAVAALAEETAAPLAAATAPLPAAELAAAYTTAAYTTAAAPSSSNNAALPAGAAMQLH